MKFIAVPLLALFLAALTARAADPGTSSATLLKLRGVYDKELEKVDEKYAEEMKLLPQQYLSLLLKLERAYQNAGDLKPLIAVREERDRFNKSKSLKEIVVAKAPAKLAELQQQFLKDCEDIPVNRARRILDLNQKYVAALDDLQRELTKRGEINQALAVMGEIERVQADEKVKSAKFQLAAKGADIQPKNETERPAVIDVKLLSQKLHGEVMSWNSMTRQVMLRYDFSSDQQLRDWEGAAIQADRLSCSQSVGRNRVQFDGILSISYEGCLVSGSGPIAFSVGDSLYAHIGAGEKANRNRLFQNNENVPVCDVPFETQASLRYNGSLTIQEDGVIWTVDGKLMAKQKLPLPINYPVQVSFGDKRCHTTFDGILIHGILNPAYLDALVTKE